ncbi:hypothetical protein AA106555_1808 [Neokomagataea thailandica NBRC 106555]|uniref:Uncharacterized protein n=1 Tax=Neokomagataea thailandica NBRC 106555 TaxID=1223520 RepID=A0ABQ0QS07_9PROT|nr:hypothetical protein AA106555_1808 [Neokomagataea thailandica NBRC 106555]
MVKGEFVRGEPIIAILALKVVPQENIETREGGLACGWNVIFQRNDAREFHSPAWGVDEAVIIFREDGYTVQEYSLDGFLP